jgi:hypothetical protein
MCGAKNLPNKKWAVSPLISPPAGIPTATKADKFVCILSIRRFAAKFNALTLIRACIELELRKDHARMENSQIQVLTESLRKHGIADQVISAAIAEAQLKSA